MTGFLKALLAILAVVAATTLTGTATSAASTQRAAAFTLPAGTDLHDGTIVKYGHTYYAYGTRYACGFQWRRPSPWCGFGVSTARALTGPWTRVHTLVGRWQHAPVRYRRLNALCSRRTNGAGCFNPRMIRRADGQYLLWFNAVAARTSWHNNAYIVMGCRGPAGPCGREAGGRHGFTH